MIKKIIIAILVALPLSMSAQKIGVVDLMAIVQASPETAAAQKTLQETQTKYQADLQKLQEEAQKAYDEYNKLKGDASTPATILERHEKSLAEMSQKIQQHAQTYEQDLQQQQDQLMAPIIDKVQKAAQAVGQEKGLTVVLPKGAVLYMSAEVLDLDPLVKAKLGI